jgi:hypothetical protein
LFACSRWAITWSSISPMVPLKPSYLTLTSL